VCIAFCKRFATFLLKRWKTLDLKKILCMLKKIFSPERFATFANDRVTSPTHAQRWKNDYGHLPTFTKKSENDRRALAKTSWCDGFLRECKPGGGGIFQTRVYGFGGLQTRVPGYTGLMKAYDIGLPINLACGGYTWQCRLAVVDLAYKQLRCYRIGNG